VTAQDVRGRLTRRDLVAQSAGLNGIDFIEVLDRAAPPNSPRQQTLLVHCLKSVAGIDAAHVSIAGGVRISPVRVVWVYQASASAPAGVSPAESTLFAALPDAANVLVVRTDAAGDFSTYTLTVAGPPTTAAPFAFDPQLASVDVAFKVECPSDFDCQAAAAPAINYLAKDYASFRQLMLDRLAVTVPAWQERNAADLGVALVEVLAYSADYLSYYQDAVATEAYLGTARRRVSVRRHAQLLDYAMHDGCNARAWIFVDVAPGSGADGATLPAGTPLEGLQPGSPIFETLHAIVLNAAHDALRFYTWSNEVSTLPAGSTAATLTGGSGVHLVPGDAFVFEEVVGPATGLPEDADPAHRHVVRLTSVTPGTDPLDGTPIVEIAWGTLDALPFALALNVAAPGTGVLVTDVSLARGNLVLADHGSTVVAEPVVPQQLPARGPYRPRLAQIDVTFTSGYDDETARSQPAASALAQDARLALASVALSGATGAWTVRRTLLDSGPFSADFVVETENDGSATLRFGDGVLGAPPLAGLVATYRVGNGAAGNVGAGAIAQLALPRAGIRGVRNPLPATGGVDPESLADVRMYAPQAFRTQTRTVTPADYVAAAQAIAGVARAQAIIQWTGSWQTAFVTVERSGGLPVDAAFKAGVRSGLEPLRLAGIDLEIEAPVYVPLDIAFTISVAANYFAFDVKSQLLAVFGNGVLPNGQLGFFNPANFTFGQPVYLSRMVATAMAVPGVMRVDTGDTPPQPNRFRRWAQTSRGELAAGRVTLARLEIARLDNDPNRPENGMLDFFMQGGL
jgi:hypothetical protein